MTGDKPREKLLCMKMNPTPQGLITSNYIQVSRQERRGPSIDAHDAHGELLASTETEGLCMLFPVLNPSKKLSKLSAGSNATVSYEFDCQSNLLPMQ